MKKQPPTTTLAHDVKALAYHLSCASSPESRTSVLRHFGTDPFVRKAVAMIFDYRITRWADQRGPVLPDGMPPLDERPQNAPAPIENAGMFRNLVKEGKVFTFFRVEGIQERINISAHRLQFLFMEMLRDIHPEDRILLVSIKDKVWPYDDIYPLTAQEVAAAWSDVLVAPTTTPTPTAPPAEKVAVAEVTAAATTTPPKAKKLAKTTAKPKTKKKKVVA
jgi:hypothetical protein